MNYHFEEDNCNIFNALTLVAPPAEPVYIQYGSFNALSAVTCCDLCPNKLTLKYGPCCACAGVISPPFTIGLLVGFQ